MENTHDPYLNTVKRSLNEAKIKSRKNKIKKDEVVPKSFWSQNIIISNYIYLPESLQKFFLLSIFILIPYFFGMLVMFTVMGYAIFQESKILTLDIFMLRWTVGYESIALLLLTLILKSSFNSARK